MDIKGQVDFAIVTIREDEYRAVLKRFPHQAFHRGRHRTYSISRVPLSDSEHYLVACAPSLEQGGGHSQDVTRDIIEDLDPNVLLLVGIGGGVPEREFTLGDVVVAKRLHDFSVAAALESRDLQATNEGGPMHKFVQDLFGQLPALEGALEGWNSREQVGEDRPPVDPENDIIHGDETWVDKVRNTLRHHFGPQAAPRGPLVTARSIASGNLLVKDSRKLKDWLERARELAAIEMELNGVYIAARRLEREYPIVAIRGLSDIIGLERDARWTAYACHSAASFARAFVQARLVEPRLKKF